MGFLYEIKDTIKAKKYENKMRKENRYKNRSDSSPTQDDYRSDLTFNTSEVVRPTKKRDKSSNFKKRAKRYGLASKKKLVDPSKVHKIGRNPFG